MTGDIRLRGCFWRKDHEEMFVVVLETTAGGIVWSRHDTAGQASREKDFVNSVILGSRPMKV